MNQSQVKVCIILKVLHFFKWKIWMVSFDAFSAKKIGKLLNIGEGAGSASRHRPSSVPGLSNKLKIYGYLHAPVWQY
jgi:hypothetical protein